MVEPKPSLYTQHVHNQRPHRDSQTQPFARFQTRRLLLCNTLAVTGKHNSNGGPYSSEATVATPSGMEEARWRQGKQQRETGRYSAAELMRWRKFDSVLRSSLFEPYISPILQGTWLLNVWLKAMGAHVSMGALVLGLVKDYDMVQVSEHVICQRQHVSSS